MKLNYFSFNNYSSSIVTQSLQAAAPFLTGSNPEYWSGKGDNYGVIAGDVSDVVGGLWEVDSTIDTTKFNDEFLKILMKKPGGTLEKNNLSSEELQLLISRGKKRLEDEEWLLKGNNENFI